MALGSYIVTSPDGITWTVRGGHSLDLWAVAADASGHLMAVGRPGRILTSPDGTTWTDQVFEIGWGQLSDIGWNGAEFVVAGYRILRSLDGFTWTHVQDAPTNMRAVAWGNARWVMVGPVGEIISSPDGITWTTEASGTTEWLRDVTFGGSGFVAVGNNGTVLSSPDGMSWTGQTSGVTDGLTAVVWTGQIYVAAGNYGTFITSPDAVTWTDRSTSYTHHVTDLAWNGSLFVATTNSVWVYTSPDGTSWTRHSAPAGGSAVTWNGLEFVALSHSRDPFTSTDGVNWTTESTGAAVGLLGVVPVGTELFVVGESSLIMHRFEGGWDLGDAPDPTYPTLLASNGARHPADSGLYLGAAIDSEADGQPNADATGDDTDPDGDDEDGVVFTSLLIPGELASVEVGASEAGVLSAWIDFNLDGDWDDAGEQIFADQALAAGTNPLGFTVPAGAEATPMTFARFRVSTAGGLSYDGEAGDGEVEDYQMEVVQGPDLQIEMVSSSNPTPSGDPLTYTVTVTNIGPLDATSVTLTDTLPGELFFVSSTPSSPDCTFSVDTVTCDLGTLSPSDTVQVVIETVLDHPVWGGISNTSSVSASEIDPILANNTATVDTIIAIFVDGFGSGDLSAWD